MIHQSFHEEHHCRDQLQPGRWEWGSYAIRNASVTQCISISEKVYAYSQVTGLTAAVAAATVSTAIQAKSRAVSLDVA
jgi:hypothetical protein